MHPREVPKQVQSRRKAQPGWGPGEALQQRVGLFWGLTRRAGVAKGAGVGSVGFDRLSPNGSHLSPNGSHLSPDGVMIGGTLNSNSAAAQAFKGQA